VLDGFLSGHLDDVRARQKKAIDVSAEKPADAVATLHGLAGQESSIAWDLVDKPSPTPAELARDAVASTGALDFAILDTYDVGLTKTGNAAEAARVSRRLIAVCDAVKGDCTRGALASRGRPRAESVNAHERPARRPEPNRAGRRASSQDGCAE